MLIEDLPKQGLTRGQVGKVVDVGPDSCTVEFGDKQGRIFARSELVERQLIQLRWEQRWEQRWQQQLLDDLI